MVDPFWSRTFRISVWPAETFLIAASRLSRWEGGTTPEMLSRNEALWLFDRASTDTASWFRFFVREVAQGYAWGLSLVGDETLRTYVRQAIRSGDLVAVRPGPPRERPVFVWAPAVEAAPAPVAKTRPAPAVRPPEPELAEEAEFDFTAAQCELLVTAAATGVPFCEECECARAGQKAA